MRCLVYVASLGELLVAKTEVCREISWLWWNVLAAQDFDQKQPRSAFGDSPVNIAERNTHSLAEIWVLLPSRRLETSSDGLRYSERAPRQAALRRHATSNLRELGLWTGTQARCAAAPFAFFAQSQPTSLRSSASRANTQSNGSREWVPKPQVVDC